MFWVWAAAISSSRKSGWAMEISASARSKVLRPARFTAPYYVTIQYIWLRGEVTMSPWKVGTIRDRTAPVLSV